MSPFDPPLTPPAYVVQLERCQERHQRDLADLRSKVDSNHLAVLHQLGEIARVVRAVAVQLGVTP